MVGDDFGELLSCKVGEIAANALESGIVWQEESDV